MHVERGAGTEVRKAESYPGLPVEGSGAADIPHTRLYRGALRRGENQAAPSPGGPQEGAEAARPDGQLTMPSHERGNIFRLFGSSLESKKEATCGS